MFFIAIFKQNNAMATGLSPTIDVWRADDTTKVVAAGAMTEFGASGIYYYDFSASYDNTKTYAAVADGGATLADRYVSCGCVYRDPEATLDVIEDSVDNIAIGSSGISIIAESFTLAAGSETNTYTNTQERDGQYHQLDDDGDETDGYYQFDIGATGVPSSVTFYGRLFNFNDDMKVFGYNWGSTTWEQIGTIAGKVQSTDEELTFSMYSSHVGTGANAGKVRIRFQNTGLTSSVLYVDQLYVSYAVVASPTGYANGAIWIDTVNGTSGTVNNVNGVADNPVDNIADANTLATSLGLSKFYIMSGSTITFATSQQNQVFEGFNWTLVLNGQDVSGSIIMGAISITGICTGATAPEFKDSMLGAITIPPSHFTNCGLMGTITAGSAGNFYFDKCHSMVAGTSTPVFDFGSGLNASNLNFRLYSGGIEVKNMGAGSGSYNMSLEGFGQLVINANCSATSLIAVRGHFTITDNASGAVTLSNLAMFDHNTIIDDILTDVTGINGDAMRGTDNAALAATTALEATLTAMKGVGWSTETLKAIKDAIDAIAAADATLANQNDMIDKLKGLMSKDYSLLAAVGTFDPATDSNEAIRNRGDLAWDGQLTGSNTAVLTIQDGNSNNIVQCNVEVWDQANSAFYERQLTDSNGQVTFNIDDGTYTIRIHKAGYTFTNQTLVVDGNETATYTGTAFNPGTPSTPDACRVYDYVFDPEGGTPVSSLTATAEIVALPYDSGSMLHVGSSVTGTYNSSTGLIYWDIVQGATVKFYVPGTGICGTCVVPSTSSARLSDQTLT
jgi:hypothetical protein